EYIIVDGASDDGTPAIVARHRDVVTKFVSEPDEGIYHAMNKGVHLASGDFIFFLGADDYLLDGAVLSDVAGFLEWNSGCDLAYGGISVRSSGGRSEEFLPPPPDQALEFLVVGSLPHQAIFASRRAFSLLGGFDERYRIAGDYDWILRAVAHSDIVVRRFERLIASYRLGGLSDRLELSQREVYRIQNQCPIFGRADWVARRARLLRRTLLSHRRKGERLARSLVLFALARSTGAFWRGPAPARTLPALQNALLAQRLTNVRLAQIDSS